MAEYNPKEVNKLIRMILKEEFPRIKFSVKKSSGGSPRVSWVDGPPEKKVQDLVKQFGKQRYDMEADIWVYDKIDQDYWVDFVFTERTYSDDSVEDMLEDVIDTHSLDMIHPEKIPGVDPEIVTENTWVKNGHVQTEKTYEFKFGGYWLNDYVMKLLKEEDLS